MALSRRSPHNLRLSKTPRSVIFRAFSLAAGSFRGDPLIIYNMGIPRSGTVWAFNVFRLIWEHEGIVFRTESPNSPGDVDRCIASLDVSEPAIVHFHDITPAAIRFAEHEAVRPFFNYRDPRDVVVSQMKLHDVSFEQAVKMTRAAYQNLGRAVGLRSILLIPYDHIREHAEALIFQMAARLGILLNLQTVRTIAEKTSAASHRQIMQSLNEADGSGESQNAATINTGRREIRFDRKHLITDRHIQHGQSGRWRQELNSAEQVLVNRHFAGEVARLGFGT